MEIKKINGEIIFKADVDNIKDAVEEAVMRGADLGGANLVGANLYCAKLYCANLRNANLYCANLYCANLRNANLCKANLYCANLRNANLCKANLDGANLCKANLDGANLDGANLDGANLYGADLGGANLYCANLRNANLCKANLRGAKLGKANLYGANLDGAKNIPFVPLACPSDGEFTGWKKVNGLLVELRIPEDARRSSATKEKCRCDKALVVSITDIDSCEEYAETTNCNYAKTTYRVGEMVYPDSFDTNRWNECGHGIHFFTNKESAMNY